MSLADTIARLDWPRIEAQLNEEGCAILPGVLGDGLIAELMRLLDASEANHDAWIAEEGLGGGERFRSAVASASIDDLRRRCYERLVPIANHWNAVRDLGDTFPGTLDELIAQGRGVAGDQAHSSFTRLRTDGYEALHQYGERPDAFPLQLVAVLVEPGKDFTGGEFVLTEQRPRMQSRPMVLPLRRGDLAVIAVAQRPHKGSKGYYRVNLKHAISRVRGGERIGLELLFDDVISA